MKPVGSCSVWAAAAGAVTCAASSAKAGKLGNPAAKASSGRRGRRLMIGVKIFFTKF